MVKTITVTEPLLKVSNTLGEGNVWDSRTQRLYWVDIEEKKVFTYEPSTGTYGYDLFAKKITALAVVENATGLIGTSEDEFIYIPESSLPFPPTSSLQTYIPFPLSFQFPEAFNRFNDAGVDPRGRYLGGTMGMSDGHNTGGTMYSLQPDADASVGVKAPLILDDITCSNGMGWNKDGTTMYFTDSWREVINAYDYDLDTGKVSNPKVFSKLPTDKWGWPDGACTDAENHFWSARWKAGKIVRFTPEGEIVLVIEFPKAWNITNVIFGGPDLEDLYVTTAKATTSGDDQSKYPDSGDLYVVKGLGIKGVERNRYKGPLPK